MWIAEAGATKTDWVCTDGALLRLSGLNMEVEGTAAAEIHFRSTREALQKAGWPWPERLYYYGPALHRLENQQVLQQLLCCIFPEIRHISVAHDLLAAARAAWGKGPGLVCILGTGSNCAEYDGESLIRQRGGHGYLLGDDGSGADLGKQFLSALLHDEVPTDLRAAFQESHAQPLWAIRQAVYQAARPSAYLAQFALFLSAHQSHAWVQALVKSRLEAFIGRTWAKWETRLPIRYVGGVASAFEALLREATEGVHGIWGGVVTSPAQALLVYHLSA
jgi:N-acetylglucosamine kinase-like BadF-type ATPase